MENDKLIELRLYSPHKCDFIWQREDGSYYAIQQKSGKDREVVEVEKDDTEWNGWKQKQ